MLIKWSQVPLINWENWWQYLTRRFKRRGEFIWRESKKYIFWKIKQNLIRSENFITSHFSFCFTIFYNYVMPIPSAIFKTVFTKYIILYIADRLFTEYRSGLHGIGGRQLMLEQAVWNIGLARNKRTTTSHLGSVWRRYYNHKCNIIIILWLCLSSTNSVLKMIPVCAASHSTALHLE